jgi:hypothetical protein
LRRVHLLSIYIPEKNKEVFRIIDIKEVSSLKGFLNALKEEKEYNQLKILMTFAINNIKEFDVSSLGDLIEFLENNRDNYKDIDKMFINFFIDIIDISLIPMLELQSNMTTENSKKALSRIIRGVKAKI